MKAFLLYKDLDFNIQGSLPANEQALTQDLELDTLFSAMSLGDKFLYEVARRGHLPLAGGFEPATFSVRWIKMQRVMNRLSSMAFKI
jgi:hypothetical protein